MIDKIRSILTGIEVYEDYIHGKPPQNYVVYSEVSDVPEQFADGEVISRIVNCQLDVLENLSNKKQLAKDVESKLRQNGISYRKINLGYLTSIDKTQVTFEFYL